MSGTVVAVDLGGTRIKAARVTLPAVDATRTVPAPPDLATALDLLDGLLADLVPAGGCAGLGLAVPGLVRADGVVQALPGKYDGIVGFPLRDWLADRVAAPAVVVNDAVAYGVGEAAWGAGRGARRVLVVTIGTGTGVAVVQDGRPVTDGPFGGGIMGGNVPLTDEDGTLLDTLGRTGTIEARCRADRIVDYSRAAGCAAADPAAVYAAHAAGDPAAVAGIATYQGWLARGLAALAVAHGVERVVVGGGPATPDAPWYPGLEALVGTQLWPSHRVDVRLGALGDAAAAVGLAHLANVSS